jgi:hypothetical protein
VILHDRQLRSLFDDCSMLCTTAELIFPLDEQHRGLHELWGAVGYAPSRSTTGDNRDIAT